VIEGEKEDQRYNHPKGKYSIKAFLMLHHEVYALVHLLFSIGLMLLVIPETETEIKLAKFTKILVSFYLVQE
jgi:hypothetical protein